MKKSEKNTKKGVFLMPSKNPFLDPFFRVFRHFIKGKRGPKTPLFPDTGSPSRAKKELVFCDFSRFFHIFYKIISTQVNYFIKIVQLSSINYINW